MLLGKRPRPPNPMKRTSSSEITFDLGTNASCESTPQTYRFSGTGGGGDGQQQLEQGFFYVATISPRNHTRPYADNFLETPHFLRSCTLCRRRLVTGRDIYMYRGDSAFCSLECRQQQINQDEKKEKCSLTSKKAASTSNGAGAPDASAKGETVAAL